MTDPIRTPADALEAAAFCLHAYWGHKATPEMVADIRALASRIAAPDDEALVERCRDALAKLHCHGEVWCGRDRACQCRIDAIIALREAGALRHE